MNVNGANNFKDDSVVKEVQDDLEFQIITGKLAPGEKIPPIRDLAVIYKIGTSTAQKIVNNLSDEGVIVKRRGIGFFVKPYIKKQLIDKHLEECKEILKHGIEIAKKLDVEPQLLLDELLKEKDA